MTHILNLRQAPSLPSTIAQVGRPQQVAVVGEGNALSCCLETDAPAGLKAGLAAANRVQDAVTSSFRTGLDGNVVLAEARRKALSEGLNPSIYSHPIGYHGHGAGAAIGFWDDQNASERGIHKLRPNTAWSIELSQPRPVPEWGGQMVQFRTEEVAFFDGQSVRYLDGRQKIFHLIQTQ